MNYYRRFIGDYQSDTGHLSVLEHGAYTLLLDLYYATGRVPGEINDICRVVRAISPKERKAVAAILNEFWVLTEAGWVNERASAEMGKVSAYREKQSSTAKARHRPATSEPQASRKLATSKPMPNQIHVHTQEPGRKTRAKKKRSYSFCEH